MAARSNNTRKWRVLYTYGRECCWCSLSLTKDNATVDHIRCRVAGGSNWLGNMLPCCKSCNSARGSSSAEDFLQDRLSKGYVIRAALIQAALARLSDPRSWKRGDNEWRRQEQERRKHNWQLASALTALSGDEWLR